MNEAEWQAQVIELAGYLGWRHLHVRRSIGKGKRWVTATNVDGWPDLFLWNVRRPDAGLVALELKSHSGKPTDEQVQVLAELEAAGVRTMIARPSDLDAVKALLAPRPDQHGAKASATIRNPRPAQGGNPHG